MNDDVIEYIGVYDADSTLIGEVSYWVGARLGRTHCSLCDLTHGLFTVKSEWKQCTRTLGVPFRTYHRNDAPVDVLAAASGSFPVVMARTNDGLKVLLTNDELTRFNGSTTEFVQWLTQQ